MGDAGCSDVAGIEIYILQCLLATQYDRIFGHEIFHQFHVIKYNDAGKESYDYPWGHYMADYAGDQELWLLFPPWSYHIDPEDWVKADFTRTQCLNHLVPILDGYGNPILLDGKDGNSYQYYYRTCYG